MKPEHCSCKVVKILTAAEEELLKSLFSRMGREFPWDNGIVELDRKSPVLSCPYLRSWGFNYYCVNKEVVEKFFKKP